MIGPPLAAAALGARFLAGLVAAALSFLRARRSFLTGDLPIL